MASIMNFFLQMSELEFNWIMVTHDYVFNIFTIIQLIQIID